MTLRPHWLALAASALAIASLQGIDRFNRFAEQQHALAERSAAGAAATLAGKIEAQRQMLRLFVDRERPRLIRLWHDPNDLDAYRQLAEQVASHFPDHLAFTLADLDGDPLFGSRDRHLGPSCRQALTTFTEATRYSPSALHAGSLTGGDSHFDLMTPLRSGERGKATFFVSLRTRALRDLLSNHRPPNQQLVLVTHEWSRERSLSTAVPSANSSALYSTSDREIEPRLLARRQILGTPWRIEVYPVADLYAAEIQRLLLEMLLLLLLLLPGVGLLLWQDRRHRHTALASGAVIDDIEGERRRIAMDLHDQVLAELSQAVRDARELGEQSQYAPLERPEIGDRVSALQQDLDRLTASIRATLEDLHPQALDIVGLEAVVRDFLERHCTPPPEWQLDADASIDRLLEASQRLHLYRITLELIRNVQRHANANRFTIELRGSDEGVVLRVEDDGRGFDLRVAQAGGGRGLPNIAVRAQSLGARIEWSRRRPTGTRFELRLNLPAATERSLAAAAPKRLGAARR